MEFIVGAILGGIIIGIFLSGFLYVNLKKLNFKRLIKKIGQKAEIQINNDLKIWAKHTKNKFIDTSLYKYDENKVFEVDSILITSGAIVVVEIKSINGGIIGDSNENRWTKENNDNKFDIANPILQNQKHIDHLINMTGYKVPIISLIVFSNRAKFIRVINKPSHVAVIKHADLFDQLDSMALTLSNRLNEEDKKMIFSKIKSFRTKKGKDIHFHKKITSRGRT